MPKRTDDDFLEHVRARLYAAVLSDVLDEIGLRHQAMNPGIRPLDDECVLAGFARTGLFREVYHVSPDENPARTHSSSRGRMPGFIAWWRKPISSSPSDRTAA